MYLLWAENSRKLPLAPSLLLQYWLAVSMQPDSYRLQVRPSEPTASLCSGPQPAWCGMGENHSKLLGVRV